MTFGRDAPVVGLVLIFEGDHARVPPFLVVEIGPGEAFYPKIFQLTILFLFPLCSNFHVRGTQRLG